MDDEITLWHRPIHQPTTGQASVALFAFSTDPLGPDIAFSMARFGAPSPAAVQGVDVRSHAGHDDPAWLDGWRVGALRTLAERDLPDAARLDTARYCHSITVEVPDPADLGHLQGVWALARWLVARGCFAVLDARAGRWWDGATLTGWAPGRPFDLDTEITITLENQPSGGFGHALHTRGMAKFARPDLITGVAPAGAGSLHRVLRALAARLAAGATAAAGHQLTDNDGRRFTLAAYRPGVNAPLVELNNDGVVLVPA